MSVIFVIAIGGAVLLALFVVVAVRLAVARSGFAHGEPLPIKDAIMSASNTIFSLMVAFSAAGIWNDTLQARTAVQREAHALQNVTALADGLPATLRTMVRQGVTAYVKRVVELDWPAMSHKADVDDKAFHESDRVLVSLIDQISQEQSTALTGPLLSQLFEARSAELSRVTLATSGVSPSQWFALVLLAICVLVSTALVHNHHLGIQVLTMAIYAVAAGAAFALLLAHARPFIGEVSITPKPLLDLLQAAF